jgi:hypothetical protein
LLEKFVAVMDTYPSVSIVSSYLEEFGDYNLHKKYKHTGEEFGDYLIDHKHSGMVSGQFLRTDFIVNNRPNWLNAPTAVMFRQAHVAKVGKFNNQLFKVTDKEYYLRLLSVGDCYVIPEVLSYIRVHANMQTNIIKERKYDLVFEKYRYFHSINKYSAPDDPLQPHICKGLKRRAIKCAKVAYKLLPKLYKKEARRKFKTALQIGKAEGVLFAPLKYYLLQKPIQKLVRKGVRKTDRAGV